MARKGQTEGESVDSGQRALRASNNNLQKALGTTGHSLTRSEEPTWVSGRGIS